MRIPFILLISLLSITYTSFSQLNIGVTGGLQQSKINETGGNETLKPYYSSFTGIHLGITSEIGIGNLNHWFIQTGANYMQKGRVFSRNYDSSTAIITDTLSNKTTFKINYIEIPLLISYKMNISETKSLKIGLGPYGGFYMNGKETSESRLFSSREYVKESMSPEVGKEQGNVHTMDIGMKYMVGIDIGKFMITGFYSNSIVPFYKTSSSTNLLHQNLGASLTIWLNEKYIPKPKDDDKDGIINDEDECPQISGSAKTHGCPDSDGDGIPDKTDKCVDVQGLAKYKGCPIPDADKDGIPDNQDKCPTVIGVAKYNGCPIPDTDNDGILDDMDQCLNIKGVKEMQGCPWPDKDGDNIPDHLDKCPTVFGDSILQGCPNIQKDLIEQFNSAAKNIFFGYKSDTLLLPSLKTLDVIAKILVAHPEISVHIDGHTDNVGNDSYNLKLSLARANSIKNYFILKGVKPEKCMATGYGSHKPLDSNATEKGRAKNRRVELTPHQ